ncbi:hypothetical protein K435DRAFT_772761 [Dendrothele bispora CBS 962.96]|uniref:Uncharacterized protein n=1 Tax=Dendrothele bispora (strain CBS 962.96) TaxID=1314807 RepID=A0A4S8MUT7_DENBC|nr:hypothetical protein K435DRAFT_772761 [Dendrothele bispora CBS 962.96]
MHSSTRSTGPRTRSRARQEAERNAQHPASHGLGVIHEDANASIATNNLVQGLPPRNTRRPRVSLPLRSPLELAAPQPHQREPVALPSVASKQSRAPTISSPLSPHRSTTTRFDPPAMARSPRPPSPIPSPAQRTSSSFHPPRSSSSSSDSLGSQTTLLKAVEARKRQGLQRNFTPAQPLDQQGTPQTPNAPKRGRVSLGRGHDMKKPSPLSLVVEESLEGDEDAVFQVGMGQPVSRPRPNRELEFLDPNQRPDFRKTRSSAF